MAQITPYEILTIVRTKKFRDGTWEAPNRLKDHRGIYLTWVVREVGRLVREVEREQGLASLDLTAQRVCRRWPELGISSVRHLIVSERMGSFSRLPEKCKTRRCRRR